MSEFKVGDRVLTLKAVDSVPARSEGMVRSIGELTIWPYEVEFPGGHLDIFGEDELAPVQSGRVSVTNMQVQANNIPLGHHPVDHPSHYTSHPSGVECIQITEHMSFTLGNAVKYVWRADLKDDGVEDLKKARWYIDREIAKRET